MARQKGFTLVYILLVVAILGVIVFVAWRIIGSSGDAHNSAQSQMPTSAATDNNDVPAIQNANNLTTLERRLNEAQVIDTAATELDTETTF